MAIEALLLFTMGMTIANLLIWSAAAQLERSNAKKGGSNG